MTGLHIEGIVCAVSWLTEIASCIYMLPTLHILQLRDNGSRNISFEYNIIWPLNGMATHTGPVLSCDF